MSAAPELRRAALARAGTMRDGRVAEVIRRSVVHARERASEAWESSDGTVRAIDVDVIVDGYALGLCESSPAVRDAVIEALTGEAPRVIGASVVDLVIAWGLRERTAESGYRDDVAERSDPDDGDDVRRAIAGYLRASGDVAAAGVLADLEVEVGARELDVLGGRAAALDAPALERAATALFARRMRVRLR